MTDVERLFADHQAGVFRYLRRIVGGLDAARDLTLDVFLRVSRAGVPASSDSGGRGWVFRIAHNTALAAAMRATRFTGRPRCAFRRAW